MNKKGFQEYGGIFSFLRDRIKNNGVFSTVHRVIKYARRYFFLAKIIKYISFIITVIETSAILIVLAAVLTISIPIILVTTAVVALIGMHKRKEFNEYFDGVFSKNGKIMFIYTDQGFDSKKSAFLRGSAKDFKQKGYTVLIVSTSLLCDRFTTAKIIENDLYVIKLSYFYSIKKRFLNNYDTSKITYIL